MQNVLCSRPSIFFLSNITINSYTFTERNFLWLLFWVYLLKRKSELYMNPSMFYSDLMKLIKKRIFVNCSTWKMQLISSATTTKNVIILKYVPSKIIIKAIKMSASFIPFSSHLVKSHVFLSKFIYAFLPYQHFQLTRRLLYETTPKIPFFFTGISFKRANKASFPNNSILYRMRCAYKEEMFL